MKKKLNNYIEIKNNNSKKFIIHGYASVFDIKDQHNDIIVKGAFVESICSLERIKLLWQHDTSKPIGNITYLEEDNYGLRVEALITDKTQLGRETIELISQKIINGLSIGFIVEKAKYDNQRVRIINKVNLLEISLVTFPAHSDAKINYDYQDSLYKLESSLEEAFLTLKQMR